MIEIYKGVCAVYANGHIMTQLIMRVGYYWMTREKDCIEYFRKCHIYQIYANKKYAPAISLHNMVAP